MRPRDADRRATPSFQSLFASQRTTMKTGAPQNVDEYIAGFPENVQIVLERVRRTIRKALPGSEEVISYKIPAFSLNGSRVLYFAGWKRHYSLYPATKRLESALKKELAPYEVNGKGTIRFPLTEPVPVKLIESIAKFRARESRESGKTKSKTPRRAR